MPKYISLVDFRDKFMSSHTLANTLLLYPDAKLKIDGMGMDIEIKELGVSGKESPENGRVQTDIMVLEVGRINDKAR